MGVCDIKTLHQSTAVDQELTFQRDVLFSLLFQHPMCVGIFFLHLNLIFLLLAFQTIFCDFAALWPVIVLQAAVGHDTPVTQGVFSHMHLSKRGFVLARNFSSISRFHSSSWNLFWAPQEAGMPWVVCTWSQESCGEDSEERTEYKSSPVLLTLSPLAV